MNLKRKNIYEKQDDKFILQEYYNYKYNKLGFIVEEKNKIRINNRYVNFYSLYCEYQGNILIKEIYNFDYNYDDDDVVEYLENYYEKGKKIRTKGYKNGKLINETYYNLDSKKYIDYENNLNSYYLIDNYKDDKLVSSFYYDVERKLVKKYKKYFYSYLNNTEEIKSVFFDINDRIRYIIISRNIANQEIMLRREDENGYPYWEDSTKINLKNQILEKTSVGFVDNIYHTTTKYNYNNDILIKKEFVNNIYEGDDYWIDYSYENNLLMKESFYDGNNLFKYIEYLYE